MKYEMMSFIHSYINDPLGGSNINQTKANRCRFKRVAPGWFSTGVVEPCLTFFFKLEVGHLCIL